MVRYAVGLGASIAIGLSTGACKLRVTCNGSDGELPVLDDAKLEATIAAWLAERGVDVKVACPEGRLPRTGDVFTCAATTPDGTELTFTVSQDDDQGNVTWKLHGVLLAATEAIAQIQPKLPASAVIACPKRTFHFKQVGDTASCDVRDGDQHARLVMTFDDARTRHISMEVTQAAPGAPPASL